MTTPELIQHHTLLEQLTFLPVPEGIAPLGMETKIAERFINSYGPPWQDFFVRETPMHEVKLAAFSLSRYPVTNDLYAQFMADGGYDRPEFWTPEGWAWRQQTCRTQPRHWDEPRFAGHDRPVVGVSWFEAMAFATWAASVTGQPIRLPSEAEWEWAARGNNTKSLYPWGGAWDASKLNSGYTDAATTANGTTTPVGAYSPYGDGPFGHADMLGQVWEWTNTAFKPYTYDAKDGREDRYAPERRVLRGGNWADGKYVNRVTCRYYYPAYYSEKTTGFRLAMGGDALPLAARPDVDLVIYGRSTFCPDLIKVKNWLHAWNVPYRQLNLDLDEAVAYRLDEWLGSRTVPTLVIAEPGHIDPIVPPTDADLSKLRCADRGSMLHEPDEDVLRAWLLKHGMLKG